VWIRAKTAECAVFVPVTVQKLTIPKPSQNSRQARLAANYKSTSRVQIPPPTRVLKSGERASIRTPMAIQPKIATKAPSTVSIDFDCKLRRTDDLSVCKLTSIDWPLKTALGLHCVGCDGSQKGVEAPHH
jgi:hypothetical protein